MSMHELNDQQLVKAYIEGSESAFEVLLNRHKDRVFHYALKMVKNRDLAEDIFQEAFFKAINTIKSGKYNEEGKFVPWIMRITHNLSIDHFRAKKKMPKISESSVVREDFNIFDLVRTTDANVEDEMVETEILDSAVSLLTGLSQDQKQIIHMRIFQGMSFKDIAEQEGISINTALGRMRYALINLRKIASERNIVLSA